MSDLAQGPDWWQASDGKWYPPEARLPPPPAGYGAPGPAPAPAKGRSGCVIAAIVVGIAFVVLILLAVVSIIAITFLGRSTSDKLSNLGNEIEGSAPALATTPPVD